MPYVGEHYVICKTTLQNHFAKPSLQNRSSCWWHTAYQKTRTEDPKKNPITKDSKKDLKEDPKGRGDLFSEFLVTYNFEQVFVSRSFLTIDI